MRLIGKEDVMCGSFNFEHTSVGIVDLLYQTLVRAALPHISPVLPSPTIFEVTFRLVVIVDLRYIAPVSCFHLGRHPAFTGTGAGIETRLSCSTRRIVRSRPSRTVG